MMLSMYDHLRMAIMKSVSVSLDKLFALFVYSLCPPRYCGCHLFREAGYGNGRRGIFARYNSLPC